MPDPVVPLRYGLEGKVVTMDDRGTIHDEAVVYVDEGRIQAVLPTSAPPPASFEGAPVVHTGGTIFPGLIELHNHLSYNVLPMWDVPGKYLNCMGWRKSSPPYHYQRAVTMPMRVLASTPGVLPAIVRYVEGKCLLAGVTSSQGLTLSADQGISKHYRGLVRNVESPVDDGLPAAWTRVAAIPADGADKLHSRLERLEQDGRCYLHHLSEGIPDNQTSHKEFLNLGRSDGGWAINRSYVGIHSLALSPEDFAVVGQHEGAMVWSPLSNLMLYGQTVQMQVPKDAGLRIALGSDWSPSGSKNLLGEIKVAYLVSKHQGGVFSLEEIAAMVTRTPAEILGWQDEVGTIEAGKRADLMVLHGRKGDPYERLLESRETSVTLVLIDGVPRCGNRRLMEKEPFAAGRTREVVMLDRSERLLDLHDEQGDPMVAGIGLGEARDTLAMAMSRLPELAAVVQNQGRGFAGGYVGEDGSRWTLELELSPEDEVESLVSGRMPPITELVEAIDLDGLAVVDDPSFFRTLAIQRNVPEYIKDELPPLYGRQPWNPASVAVVERSHPIIRERLAHATNLHGFLRTSGRLVVADFRRIVAQAVVLLEQHYVHLPLKRAMYGVDPLQRLKLLSYQLEELPEEELPSELEFHKEMLRIFNSTRDLHTRYILPFPYRDKIACLPFVIEECWDEGTPRYIVSKLLSEDVGRESFTAGVEVLHWNGVPIAQAVARNADRQAGSNRAARHARGLDSMTLRPLAHVLPPEDEWVTLRYRSADGRIEELTHEWLVFRALPGALGFDLDFSQAGAGAAPFSESTAMGLDQQTNAIHEAHKLLYAPRAVVAEGEAAEGGAVSIEADEALPTKYPSVIRAKTVCVDGQSLGYLRLFSFDVRDADDFVGEVARLLSLLPESGLVIDVRGNSGGLIHAAERLLQLFTPRTVQPQRAQFINSPLNLELCARHAPSTLDGSLDLGPWEESIRQSVTTGATYSRGHWITPPESCNALGQRYYGPVVLVTDALCYSATDIFAAGFQDHEIGVILGTSTNTGAGGANIWSYEQLHRLMSHQGRAGKGERPAGHEYAALPHGASMSVAIRRTLRVGAQSGNLVEDLGVEPNLVHRMTRDDLLHGNRDLIREAAMVLREGKAHPLRVEVAEGEDGGVLLRVATENVGRVDVTVDELPLGYVDTRSGEGSFRFARERGRDMVVELRGWEGQRMVAFRRETVRAEAGQ